MGRVAETNILTKPKPKPKQPITKTQKTNKIFCGDIL
jgi:hypothetical protein